MATYSSILSLVVASLILVTQAQYEGWEILNPRDANPQTLGKFAILQHNYCANKTDEYGSIWAARKKGETYLLIVANSSGWGYDTTVSGRKFPVLLSFKDVFTGPPVGYFMYIDPQQKLVQDYGRSTVEYYNNHTINAHLQYITLFQAEVQYGRVQFYRLIIQASNNGTLELYQGFVRIVVSAPQLYTTYSLTKF